MTSTLEDAPRLKTQRDLVRRAMADGQWWTFEQLCRFVKPFVGRVSEAGISARIRDLRKEGATVERDKVRPGSNQYRYRMSVPPQGQGRLF